jgi:predicted nucleotidyltransferase
MLRKFRYLQYFRFSVEFKMKGLLEEDRLKIAQWAERHPEIKRVYLYGSRARGDHHPDSDIDLAIEVIADQEDSLGSWMQWIQGCRNSPDLVLSAQPHLERYEKGAELKIVGPAVEVDGVLLFERLA